MAEQELTSALSSLSIKKPRTNFFSLPRELRDQIYGYLLDGEYVRTRRTWNPNEYVANFDKTRSGPAAYHFYTRILEVNKQIHTEASKLLYQRNVFLVFSYQWQGLGNELGGLLWLPIVSNKHVGRMHQHSLRVHISSGTGVNKEPTLLGDASLQSVILLAKDFEVLCLTMTMAGSSYACGGHGLAVRLPQDKVRPWSVHLPPLPGDMSKYKAARFKCELRDTNYRKIDAMAQREMLTPLARVLVPGQLVHFSGDISDFQQVERLKQIMSPSLICSAALTWAQFESVSLMKDIADSVVPFDDISFVMSLYLMLATTVTVLTYTFDNDHLAERQSLLQRFPENVEAFEVLEQEALICTACCAMKAGDMGILYKASAQIEESFARKKEEHRSQDGVSAELKAYCHNVMLWERLYGGETPPTQTIREAANELTHFGHGMHQVHDSEMLLRQPNQEALVSDKHLSLEQCSAVCLPLPSMSYHKTLMKQDKFQGWLDMKFLSSLTANMKGIINRQQKMLGIKVTAFDKLGL